MVVVAKDFYWIDGLSGVDLTTLLKLESLKRVGHRVYGVSMFFQLEIIQSSLYSDVCNYRSQQRYMSNEYVTIAVESQFLNCLKAIAKWPEKESFGASTGFEPMASAFALQCSQGSTLTFQLTSLVASDNLDFASQNNFSLAKGPTHRQKDVPSRYTPSE